MRASWFIVAVYMTQGCGATPKAATTDDAVSQQRGGDHQHHSDDDGRAINGRPPLDDTPHGACAAIETMTSDEGADLVTEGSDVTYSENPPASGPHYPV